MPVISASGDRSRTKVIIGYKVTLTNLSHRDPASKNKTQTIHAHRQKGSKTDVTQAWWRMPVIATLPLSGLRQEDPTFLTYVHR